MVTPLWGYLAISALGLSLVCSASNMIHHHMDTHDLRNVFHVNLHADVPEYEVVKVRSIRRRRGAGVRPEEDKSRVMKLQAFGRDLELTLRKSDGLFKDKLRMWAAEPNSTGSINYTELPHEYVGEAYQDEESQAAIVLHRDKHDGTYLMEGTIGHDLIVKPVPAHLRKHQAGGARDEGRSEPEFQNGTEDSDDNDEVFLTKEVRRGEDVAVESGFPLKSSLDLDDFQHKHIVYRRQSNHSNHFGDYAFMEPDDLPNSKSRTKRWLREKREAPYVIYPEILVIVDYDGYRLHGGDNAQIKRYFVSFWNGVDLRYKLLKGPKIRISIAGIIISRGRDATPYLERNRVGRDAIDSAAALTDMGKYLFRERRLPVYDIAVAITKLDMCRRQYPSEACNRGTAGFAYVGGACVVNKRLEKVNSVAIIEDTGGFSGIIVAAHEVGHLLGAVHDGSPPPTYLGGPGAEKCRWEDGFIMSDLRHTEKGFKWSPCSVASFHHFLNGDTATCLYNSPHEDESLPRMLPGKLLTLDAQCRKDRGTSACFKDDRVCAQLFCFDAGSGYCVAYRPAAEGSPCGDGQYCTNGRCIAEHENIIPDYSHNTPTYLRRLDDDTAATQVREVYANPPNATTTRYSWNNIWSPPSTQSYYNKINSYSQLTTVNPLNPQPFTPTPRPVFNYQGAVTKNPSYDTKYYDKYFTKKYATPSPYDILNKKLYPLNSPAQSVGDGDTECVDRAVIPGSLSCYDFLVKNGFHYCAYDYIKQNCCAAVKYVCNRAYTPGRRR
ncbi:unnamed protein product [Bemisia tabaci]|uniref:Peptidase M12B domain-containing protein n=1 Tax=Bemisia tabaci TaxID=7038 RepID=A0A9P0F3Y8_BEMTA|nr:unnamed protein product [Bemisia tabaci]